MLPKVSASDLIEAAKMIRPIFAHIATDVSLISSIGLSLVALCFFPASILPPQVEAAKWAFGFLALCAFLYLLFRFFTQCYQVHVGKRLLHRLGQDEKNILCIFIKQGKSTEHFDVLNGPVAALLSKGILYYPSSLIALLHMNVAIQPWAFQYLRKHPSLIGLKREEIGSEQMHSWDEPSYLPPET